MAALTFTGGYGGGEGFLRGRRVVVVWCDVPCVLPCASQARGLLWFTACLCVGYMAALGDTWYLSSRELKPPSPHCCHLFQVTI